MHDSSSQNYTAPVRELTAADVETATGIPVVTSIPLKGLLYFAAHDGQWTAFVSSSRPERHQEIFGLLIAAAAGSPLAIGPEAESIRLHAE